LRVSTTLKAIRIDLTCSCFDASNCTKRYEVDLVEAIRRLSLYTTSRRSRESFPDAGRQVHESFLKPDKQAVFYFQLHHVFERATSAWIDGGLSILSKCDFVGHALAWGPLIVGGLLKLLTTVTRLQSWRFGHSKGQMEGAINALDWNTDGLLAAAIGNGTVCIVDLAY
jgi:hypothetical protein